MSLNAASRRRRSVRLAVLGAGLAVAAVAGTGAATAGGAAPAVKPGAPAAGQAIPTNQNFVTGNVAAHNTASAIAFCPSGTNVLGGGESNGSNAGDVVLTDSYPSSIGWTAYVRNNGAASVSFTVYVVCG
jgi:hypothetical protein